jgi:hypothetical protein
MSSVGQLIPLPVADRVPVQASQRVITLHPDRKRVWGHRIYRMAPLTNGNDSTYGPDAGMKYQEDAGQLIDIYA